MDETKCAEVTKHVEGVAWRAVSAALPFLHIKPWIGSFQEDSGKSDGELAACAVLTDLVKVWGWFGSSEQQLYQELQSHNPALRAADLQQVVKLLEHFLMGDSKSALEIRAFGSVRYVFSKTDSFAVLIASTELSGVEVKWVFRFRELGNRDQQATYLRDCFIIPLMKWALELKNPQAVEHEDQEQENSDHPMYSFTLDVDSFANTIQAATQSLALGTLFSSRPVGESDALNEPPRFQPAPPVNIETQVTQPTIVSESQAKKLSIARAPAEPSLEVENRSSRATKPKVVSLKDYVESEEELERRKKLLEERQAPKKRRKHFK